MTIADERARLGALARDGAAGNEQAFRDLVRVTTPMAYGIAISVLGDASEANDALQDTYVRVWQKLSSLRDTDAAGAWIARITRNVSRDRLRGRKRRPVSLPDSTLQSLAQELVAPGASPEAELANAQRKAALVTLLGQLKENYRVVLVLRVAQDMTCPEIADALGCSVKTVETRLRRARLQLAEKLSRARVRRGEDL